MKSNKEFLEGVYKKAEEIENINNIDERKKPFAINLRTVAAAAAVIILIPFSMRIFESTDKPSIKSIPGEHVIMEAQEKGAMQGSSEIEDMIFSSSLIAIGEVTSLEDSTLYIKISHKLKGITEDNIISVSLPLDIDINPSEEVLVFLRETEASSYMLTDSSNSLFELYTVIDNTKVFRSLEGFELTLEELDNLIRGG
ncbi:MAG: hypothetical protein ACI33K_04285 [Clostridiaceae bacterium]